MADNSKKRGNKAATEAGIELRPDGWDRFEKAVDAAVRVPAQHRARPMPKRKERPASKGRVHKGKTRS
jgi:hypothetical protein